MWISSEPNHRLREAIAAAYAADSMPLAMTISAEAGALYHHLTGNTMGYPAEADTVEELQRYRLAALAGIIAAQLLEHFATDPAADDDGYLEYAAGAFLAHPRLTGEARPILEAIAPAALGTFGPIIAQALPHMFERRTDAG